MSISFDARNPCSPSKPAIKPDSEKRSNPHAPGPFAFADPERVRSGLVLGTAGGVQAGQGWYYEVQRRYDNAYQQCMYAKGNQVPTAARTSTRPARYLPPPPPRDYGYGPPPPPPR